MQIFLLAVSVLSAAIFLLARGIKQGKQQFFSTAFDAPIVIFAVAAVFSFLHSYFAHTSFFRPSILNSFLTQAIFCLSFFIPVFFLSAIQNNTASSFTEDKICFRYLLFIFIWGGLWLLYPYLKSTYTGEAAIGKIFDIYGTLLFIAAFLYLRPLISRAGRLETLYLLTVAGSLASLYGIYQFFGGEIIWDKLLNPYGRRPVSTFGNPNFLSSFVVMLLPFSIKQIIFSKSSVSRFFYGFSIFSYTGLLLCAMARSSWFGAFIATIIVILCLYKKIPKANINFLRFFAAALLFFICLFPVSPEKFQPLFFNRLSEAFSGISISKGETHIQAIDSRNPNISFYQRLFMWAGSWQMGKDSPLLGCGFGQFELFNTFYQGRLLANYPKFRDIRTHANAAHNEIAQQWAELGILGLGVFFLFAVLSTVLFAKKLKQDNLFCSGNYSAFTCDIQKNLYIPLFAAMAGMLADNMLNVSLRFAVPAALFWYILGAFTAEANGIKCAKEIKNKAVFLVFYSIIGMLFFLCIIFQTRVFLREINYFAGYKAYMQRQHVKASYILEKALKYNALDVNADYELGNVYMALAEIKKAENTYLIALKANSGYDEVYYNLAVALKKQGRLTEALSFLQISTIINPFSTQTWNLLTQIYEAISPKDFSLSIAISAYKEAALLFPEEAAYANTLGYLYAKTGDYKNAAKIFAWALRQHPENMLIAENFMLAAKKNNYEKSTEAWLKKYYYLANKLGSFNDGAKKEQTEIYLQELENFILQNPKDFRLRELKGKYLFKLKQYEEAAREMLYVLNFVPNDINVLYGLATIYEAAGNGSMAVKVLNKILAVKPHNERAAAKLALLTAAS